MYKLLKQFDRQKNNQLQKRSPIFKSLLTIGAIVGISTVIMPSKATAQCIAPLTNLNSSNYPLNTALQGSFPRAFFGGAIQFSASLSGTATWANGVQVRSDAGPAIGDYLYLQPTNASNYLSTLNRATYVLSFPIPLTSFSMVVGGLNNNDGTTVSASYLGVPIPITAANFSALSAGMSIIAPNTIFSSNTTGGTNVDTNTYLLTIPGPVDNVTVVSGKNEVGNNNTVTIGFTTISSCYATLSGTVFGDSNGSQIQNAPEVGTNAGGLNAVLVNSSNQVVATTAVAASPNGTYSFNNVVPGNYTVRITTATATVGVAPPAVTLPTNWVSTGENLNGAIDGTVDSIISVTVTPANITGINLGIEQLPTAVGGTATSQTNPGGTTAVTVPTTLFTGSTDPDGTVASYRITAFPSNTSSITINGTNYTSGTFPGAGVTVTTAQLAGMTVDPIDGAVTVGIPFQAIDNAGRTSSNTATASLPFTVAAATPSLNLVKRITAINGTNITGFISGGAVPPTSNDGDANWPAPNNTYLRGAITCPTIGICPSVRPSDLIEYTIYFLSNGSGSARNVQVCDRIPDNTVFQPDTYGSGNGILLGWNVLNGALPLPDPTNSTIDAGKVALNNVPDADAGQFLAANVSVTNAPAPCNNGALNPNGAILVRLGADIPPATLGTPTNSYGFIRFRVRVN